MAIDKKYIKALRDAEKLWEWLADNPGKLKSDYPGKRYSNSLCPICLYRIDKYGEDFCSDDVDVPECKFTLYCLGTYQQWSSHINMHENAVKIYNVLLDERLRLMEYE